MANVITISKVQTIRSKQTPEIDEYVDDHLRHHPRSSAACLTIIRVNVHNLAQVANWRSLVKKTWELQSYPLFSN
jgi:hypothetical protein